MTTDNTDKFHDLQTALTKLAASGAAIKFAQLYYCGTTATVIVLENVEIDDHGRLTMTEGE